MIDLEFLKNHQQLNFCVWRDTSARTFEIVTYHFFFSLEIGIEKEQPGASWFNSKMFTYRLKIFLTHFEGCWDFNVFSVKPIWFSCILMANTWFFVCKSSECGNNSNSRTAVLLFHGMFTCCLPFGAVLEEQLPVHPTGQDPKRKKTARQNILLMNSGLINVLSMNDSWILWLHSIIFQQLMLHFIKNFNQCQLINYHSPSSLLSNKQF